jgi:hypothetical protein
MTIVRDSVGDIEYTVNIYRDGEKLTNSKGKDDLRDYVRTIEVYESITSATLEMQLVISDSGGLIGTLTGSELFRIQLTGTVYDRTYYMRSYNIQSRSRVNQTSDIYIVNLVSDEFVKNEVVNIFGNTEVIFKGNTETSQIVKKILKGGATASDSKKYLGTKKKLFLEETLNRHTFIIPNWRPFDAIYWMCQRSVRKSQKGGTLQNGFAFFENALGYHFKSIDKMIDDINNQTGDQTNPNTGKVRLYSYTQSPKNIGNGSEDQFRISKVVFPEEKNFLMGLRHGSWSGFSIGFDPNTLSNSRYGESTDMSVDAHRYSISSEWKKMSHLKGGRNTNPISNMDKEIQSLIGYPKRVRYTVLPNQIFDPKNQDNPQKNYEQLVELQAYQWMRFESLKSTKLQIEIPGNLDLYVGSGIDITIPGTFKEGDKPKIDPRFSGRYLIAGLTHKILGTTMNTELLLMKDSII